jgi:predicted RNase H-like nuclease (RuvC/YqgF family)
LYEKSEVQNKNLNDKYSVCSSKIEEYERKVSDLDHKLNFEISKNDSKSKQIASSNEDIKQLLKVVQHNRDKTNKLENE